MYTRLDTQTHTLRFADTNGHTNKRTHFHSFMRKEEIKGKKVF